MDEDIIEQVQTVTSIHETLTGYTGYDPEVGGGVDYGNYPQSRTFMLGLNVNF